MSNILLKDLTPGSQYYVQIRGNGNGTVSDWSPRFGILTTSDAVPPDVPTGLAFVSTGNAFVATWNAVNMTLTQNKDFDHYELALTANSITIVLRVPDVQYTLDLESNIKYFSGAQGSISAKVRSVDATGNASAYSSPVVATNPVPNPPTGGVVNVGVDSIDISWTAPTDLDLVGYNVYTGATSGFTPSGANRIYSGNTTRFTYTTTTYSLQYFKIRAVDVFGQESTDLLVSGTPVSPFVADVTAPATPTSLAATITNNANGIGATASVTWVMSSPPSDLAGYNIRYRPVSTTPYQYMYGVDSGVLTATVQYLTAFTNYEFQIQAYDFSSNKSAWSATYTATSPTNAAPANVTGLTSSAGNNSITYSWTAVADTDIKNYEVTFSTSPTFASGNTTFLTGTSTTLTVGGLTYATTYYARVRAVDTGGLTSAAWSGTDTKATGAAPATSDGLAPSTSPTPTITSGIGYLFVSWTAITNADPVTYEVHVSTTTGFTPGAGTKAAEISGTAIALENDGAGASLAYGTTYFVKLIAKDKDGAAAAGTQASGTVSKVTAVDSALTAANVGAYSTSQTDTLLNGKNKNTYSTVAPTASDANIVGDLWFVRNAGTGIVTALYEGTGGTGPSSYTWTAKTLDNATIANLDAGKITTGFLSAGRIQTNTIDTTKLTIANLSNMIEDPGFELGGINWSGNGALTTIADPANGGTKVWAVSSNGGLPAVDYNPGGTGIPVVPGEVYYLVHRMRKTTATAATGLFSVVAQFSLDATFVSGTTVTSNAMNTLTQNVWVTNSAQFTVPAGTNRMYIRARFNGVATGDTVQIDDFVLRKASETTLIVDGAIIAAKIATGAVTANKLSVIVGGGNMVPDSNFEVASALYATGGWIINGGGPTGVKDTTQKWQGTQSLKVTPNTVENWGYYSPAGGASYTSGPTRPQAVVGTTYTASVWVYLDTGPQTLSLYDYGASATRGPDTVVPATTWTRLTVTFVAGATVFISPRVSGRGSAITGNMWLDGFQIEQGDVMTAYSTMPEEIQPGTIQTNMLNANIITANEISSTAFTGKTFTVGASGFIRSASYSAGVSGFSISTNGIEMNDANSKIKVEALQAGTIGGVSGAGVINIAAGTSLKMNGGALYSNTYGSTTYNSGATAGWFLDDTHFHIPQGQISASALAAGTVTAGAIAIGAGGSITSTGFSLSNSGLTVTSGAISAAALTIQQGNNLLNPEYADFEYNPTFYNGYTSGSTNFPAAILSSSATASVVTAQKRFNQQALQVSPTSATTNVVLLANNAETDYNLPLQPNTTYIVSYYGMVASGGTATTPQFRLQMKGTGTNLITNNNDFESPFGYLSNWTTTGAPTTANTGRTNTGRNAASLTQAVTGADVYISQTVNVSANTQYTFSAYRLVPATLTGGALSDRSLYWIDNGTGSGASALVLNATSATNTWVKDSVTFTTSATATSVTLRLYAPNGTVIWDTVSLEAGASTSPPLQVNNNGGASTIPANGTWSRYSVTITTPSTGVTGDSYLNFTTNTGTGTFWLDGLQVEQKMANSNTPSAWTPPGLTSIDGSTITTGSLRSTAIAQTTVYSPIYDSNGAFAYWGNPTTVNDKDGRLAWYVDPNGAAEFGNLSIRGNVVLGNPNTTDFTGNYNVLFNSTSGSPLIVGFPGTFTPGDVGLGFTGPNIPGGATIASYVNSQSVNLSANATATASGQGGTIVNRVLHYASQIASANYVQGTSGWMITSDGNAEFQQIASQSIDGDAITANTLDAKSINGGTITAAVSLAGSFTTTIAPTAIDLNTTVSSTAVTTTNGQFLPDDVGCVITGANIPANTTIATYTDATHITISVNATATASDPGGQIYRGRSVTINPQGVFLASSNGTPVITLPTDVNTSAYFSGNISTSSLTVNNNLQINGTTNNVMQNSSLGLSAGSFTAPAPTMVFNYTSRAMLASNGIDTYAPSGVGISPHSFMYDPTNNLYYYVYTQTNGKPTLRAFNAPGHAGTTYALTQTIDLSPIAASAKVLSMTSDTSNFYFLTYLTRYHEYYVVTVTRANINANTVASAASNQWVPPYDSQSGAIAVYGGNLYIATIRSDTSKLVLQKYTGLNPSSANLSFSTTKETYTNSALVDLQVGKFDMGGTNVYAAVTMTGTSKGIKMYLANSSPFTSTAYNFDAPSTAAGPVGTTWYSAAGGTTDTSTGFFQSWGSGGTMYDHTGFAAAQAATNITSYMKWRNNTAVTVGPISPGTTAAIVRRSKMTLTASSGIPSGGPNSVQFLAKADSGTAWIYSEPATSIITASYTALLTANVGTTVAAMAVGTPATITNGAGLIISGNGAGEITTGKLKVGNSSNAFFTNMDWAFNNTATTNASGQVTFTHHLGVTPVGIWWQDANSNAPLQGYPSYSSSTSTTITIQMRNTTTNAAAGTGLNVTGNWLVVA